MSAAGSGSESDGITVVIPAYKAEATIRRTINSVLAQPGVTAKVVVVIDGKLDRTAEVIADYPRARVRAVEHPTNLGAAISRNDGLSAADTPFVMFLDADDFLEGPLLSGLVRRLKTEEADIGFGPMQVLHEADLGDGRMVDRLRAAARARLAGSPQGESGPSRGPVFQPDFRSAEDVFRKWHLEGIFVAPCSVVWRTDFIRSVGGWDPELTRNDDGELVMRAILKGGKFVIGDEGRGVYVKHSSESLSQRPDNLQSMLRANEKLMAIDSPVIPARVQAHVCAGHYFNIAWQGYAGGRDDVADVALRKSRAMGFGTRGRLPHRIAFRVFGLKRTVRALTQIRRALRAAPAPAGRA